MHSLGNVWQEKERTYFTYLQYITRCTRWMEIGITFIINNKIIKKNKNQKMINLY